MKRMIPKEVLKDNAILVRARKLAVPATSIVKFVDYDGIKGVVALVWHLVILCRRSVR